MKINISPTLTGFRRIKQVFEAGREQAKENIEKAVRMLGDLSIVFDPDDREIFEKALELYIWHEEDRIESFKGGIAECETAIQSMKGQPTKP